MTTITQDGDTINGIMVGDIFEVTIIINKSNDGVYSLGPQTIKVLREGNESNPILTFTIPNDNTPNNNKFGVSNSEVLNDNDNVNGSSVLPSSLENFDGGGIHSSHVYQLPKTPKRKIRQISNKTLRKKQQRVTRR